MSARNPPNLRRLVGWSVKSENLRLNCSIELIQCAQIINQRLDLYNYAAVLNAEWFDAYKSDRKHNDAPNYRPNMSDIGYFYVDLFTSCRHIVHCRVSHARNKMTLNVDLDRHKSQLTFLCKITTFVAVWTARNAQSYMYFISIRQVSIPVDFRYFATY